MFRKFLSFTLTALLMIVPLHPFSVAAKPKADKAERVKAAINKLGTGRETQVEIKLRDKTKLAGYVSAINDEAFTVADARTGNETVVTYPNVSQVKGQNVSTGAKIAIISLSVAVAVLAFLLFLENYG